MKKYFDQLRPLERRLVIGVVVVVFIVLNWAFVWPHFVDWSVYSRRLDAASNKLKTYRATVAQMPGLQQKISQYESLGDRVAPEDQGVNLIRTIQNQAPASGVQLQTLGRSTTTSDPFFVKQMLGVNVLATEVNLVDFLYKLGSGASMIRVRDLSLQPDPPHQRLQAEIRVEASYQKNPPASALNSATAKAK